VCTAEEVTADFNSVADHPAFAMFANGCDGLDRTFEAVEGMPRARGNQLETLVIVISTNFALCHKKPQHHRHPIMYIGNQRVWLRRKYGACFNRLVALI